MPVSRVKIYRWLVLDIELDAAATFTFLTELPGAGVAAVLTTTIGPTTGRVPLKIPLPGNAKGRYCQVKIAPTGVMWFYSMVLWGKPMGEAQETSWTWAAGPVTPTPEEWAVIPLPIPPTGEEWSVIPLPIPPTGEEWSVIPLPIPPTSEEWQVIQIPIPPTPETWQLFKLPVPESSLTPSWADLPVDQ